MAALSAAWALTETPNARANLDIEVHEAGWRLGGKCANHRGVHGRVEEHGLHVLLGAYHNTFKMMRAVYGSLDRPAGHPLRTFADAVGGNDLMSLYEEIDGQFVPWKVKLPVLSGFPGDDVALNPTPRNLLGLAAGFIERLRKDVAAARRDGTGVGHELRRAMTLLEVATLTIRGLVADGVLYKGIDSLDNEDLRVWLRRHGASERAVNSAPMRSLYQVIFAEPDLTKPNSGLSAATGVRCMLRWVLCYRGHMAYWMQGGTSEVLVAPLYEALQARGVRFRFFSRCSDLQLDASKQHVDRIELRQDDRGRDFAPTYDVKGIACWLKEAPKRRRGQRERSRTLKRGEDFDDVILGVPVAALAQTCPSLIAEMPRWQQMIDGIATTRTLGLQVWSDRKRDGQKEIANTGVDPLTGYSDMSHLLRREQWPRGQAPKHVLHVCHRMGDDDALEAAGDDAWQAHGRQVATQWLAGRGGQHVPGARGAGPDEDTDFSVFHLPDTTPGHSDRAAGSALDDKAMTQRRLDAQFTVVATTKSDRYTLALPGTLRFRLRPDDSGVANLALCGTWTRNGLNVGTVESAVTSGRLAARAVAGDSVTLFGPFARG